MKRALGPAPDFDWPAPPQAGSRYSTGFSLSDLHDSHVLGVLSVGPGSRVLDVGCAAGEVAAHLVERGCRVWGVEVDGRAAEAARRVCEAVEVVDLETE